MLRALILALLPLSVASQAEVYRWVDEQGNVVFSDRPQAGAEPVQLPEISTYEAPAYDSGVLRPETPEADGGVRYAVDFLHPTREQTLRDNQGNVAARLQVEPELRRGHRIVMELDGGAQTVEVTEPEYLFTGLDRGTHELQAWVVDADGERLGEAAATQFHLHQASRLFTPPDTDGDAGAPPSSGVQQAPRAPTAPRFQYNPSANGN